MARPRSTMITPRARAELPFARWRARRCVSLGTVPNVLIGSHLVAAATRQRVLEVIDQIGFIRSSGREAASLRMLQEQRVQGIVITPSGCGLRKLEALQMRGTHVVLLAETTGSFHRREDIRFEPALIVGEPTAPRARLNRYRPGGG